MNAQTTKTKKKGIATAIIGVIFILIILNPNKNPVSFSSKTAHLASIVRISPPIRILKLDSRFKKTHALLAAGFQI
jgi:hypothetical protein